MFFSGFKCFFGILCGPRYVRLYDQNISQIVNQGVGIKYDINISHNFRLTVGGVSTKISMFHKSSQFYCW